MQNTNSPDASSYILVSVLLQSERLSEDVELRENVTDVDIFEHMDKPYLTAQVLFIDNEYILEQIDILGAERISITVHSMQEETVPITKNFYISKVLNTEKSPNKWEELKMVASSKRIRFWSAPPPRTLNPDAPSPALVTPGKS